MSQDAVLYLAATSELDCKEPGLRAALGPHPLLNSKFRMSESAVEKQVTTILSKLDLSEETQVHRRVAPVLTFLREANLSHAGTQ